MAELGGKSPPNSFLNFSLSSQTGGYGRAMAGPSRAPDPAGGPWAEPRRQTHLGKNLWQINLKSGLFSVAVYTPISDPISDVHWLVRRKIGSAVRGCAKLFDIRMQTRHNFVGEIRILSVKICINPYHSFRQRCIAKTFTRFISRCSLQKNLDIVY